MQTGTLPDSAHWDAEAAKTRSQLAMLAARDLANVAMKHAVDFQSAGEPAVAAIFEKTAAKYRDLERGFARAAGITE